MYFRDADRSSGLPSKVQSNGYRPETWVTYHGQAVVLDDGVGFFSPMAAAWIELGADGKFRSRVSLVSPSTPAPYPGPTPPVGSRPPSTTPGRSSPPMAPFSANSIIPQLIPAVLLHRTVSSASIVRPDVGSSSPGRRRKAMAASSAPTEPT